MVIKDSSYTECQIFIVMLSVIEFLLKATLLKAINRYNDSWLYSCKTVKSYKKQKKMFKKP